MINGEMERVQEIERWRKRKRGRAILGDRGKQKRVMKTDKTLEDEQRAYTD